MNQFPQYLWLIPAFPLLAAGLSAVTPRPQRRLAAGLAIGAMCLALVCSGFAFVEALRHSGSEARQFSNFTWLTFGQSSLRLGWLLDPLSAVMLVMVSFVGLLIFIYSVGYMEHDENFTRFFCFLSLFAAAMLGLVIANNLLLLFGCWELVGLTSYLLIGFWYHKPSAAAAAKKAFITTRIGDLALLLGMVWLYSQTGTLLFYDTGEGCLESGATSHLALQITGLGLAASTGIGLLIFCGAVGKSGQLPLHVWLPDAMEGPTPVSALIHAATMVAAGVFLVARMYPLMSAHAPGLADETPALQVVTWVGAITAVFAASIAVAQTDIKRILAYSTVSQLGYMMLGLGVGGVAVGMFHLITHAFFKALLFLGAGSVIHGCHDEQDIRRMGGLRRLMPITFATYAVGMLALAGFPLLFSGFWSKDEILHASRIWKVTAWPFYLGVFGAFLTAFYMMRQVLYVFFGKSRAGASADHVSEIAGSHDANGQPGHQPADQPHESPGVMTKPLVILAVGTIFLGFVGTPAWRWFQGFLEGHAPVFSRAGFSEPHVLSVMGFSAFICFVGLTMGWWLYGRTPSERETEPDPVARLWPNVYAVLERKYFVDEMYEWAVVGLNAFWARFCDALDRWCWGLVVQLMSLLVVGISWVNRTMDENLVNLGFDAGCGGCREGGSWLSRLQDGRVQHYLRVIGIALVVLVLVLLWGCRAP